MLLQKITRTAVVALAAFAGLFAVDARAHFVWIQANVDVPGQYSVHFGDGAFAEAEPRFSSVLKKHETIFGGGEVIASDSYGGQTWTAADFTKPVGTSLTYGLFGGGERRSVLRYHAKGAPTLAAAGELLGQRFELTASASKDRQWITIRGHFDGAPAARAELVFLPERGRSSVTLELDEKGELVLPAFGDGPLQMRANWKEEVGEMEFDGETVSTISHYATLLVSQAGPAQDLTEGSERWAWQRLRRAELCTCSGIGELEGGELGFTLKAGGESYNGSLQVEAGQIQAVSLHEELNEAHAAYISETLEQWFNQRTRAESGLAPAVSISFGETLMGDSDHEVVALGDEQSSRLWIKKDQIERKQMMRDGLVHTVSYLDYTEDEEGNTLPTLMSQVVMHPADADTHAGQVAWSALHRDTYTEREGIMAPRSRTTEIFHGGQIESLELSLSWSPRN